MKRNVPIATVVTTKYRIMKNTGKIKALLLNGIVSAPIVNPTLLSVTTMN